MSLEQVLSELRVSMDRLSTALEASLKHPPILIPEAVPEKKSSAKTKKVTSPELAPVAPPAQEKAPEVPNAIGPEPVSTSSDTPAVEDDFLGEEKPKVTVEALRAEAIRVANAKGQDVVRNIIKTIGNAEKISGILPEKFEAVMEALGKATKG